MAPDTWSGIITAACAVAPLLGSGGWALYRVCRGIEDLRRRLAELERINTQRHLENRQDLRDLRSKIGEGEGR